MIFKHMKIFKKNCYWSKRWLHNWLFVRLSSFQKNYEMIAVALSQQINFTVNLDRTENTKLFFIIEEAKETVLNFSKGTVKVLL